jgi:nitroimidazol reductase NimA-like FMN-containing flavoprotein (pyridoxamine 5'-phosphate oxidase superfamily)
VSERVPPEVEELLTSEPLTAYLATSREARPHVAPVWYRYEDGVVEVMTTGRKLENLRSNPRVSLAVQKERTGIPEWTVTLLGTAEVVEDEAENRAANERINRKYGVEPDSWEGNTLVRVTVGSASYRTY